MDPVFILQPDLELFRHITVKPVYNYHPYQHENWSLETGYCLIQATCKTSTTVKCYRLPVLRHLLPIWTTMSTYKYGLYRQVPLYGPITQS